MSAARSNNLSPTSNDDRSSGISSMAGSPLYPDIDSSARADRERQEEEWKANLARLEYEIGTLKTVLNAKYSQAAELKRKLGITPIAEIKQDLQQGIQTIKESDAYQKTGTALKNIGEFASRKLSDVKNSDAFKSVEDKVGEAYQSVKVRAMSLTKSEPGFDDSGSGATSEKSHPPPM